MAFAIKASMDAIQIEQAARIASFVCDRTLGFSPFLFYISFPFLSDTIDLMFIPCDICWGLLLGEESSPALL